MSTREPKSKVAGIEQPVDRDGAQTFGGLGVENDIESRLSEIGFKHPTAIQARIIPDALAGRDVIGLAETGSGKTAAFCLPLIQILRREGGEKKGLVLSPTREIALQTQDFLEHFQRARRRRDGGFWRGLSSVCLIGGVKIGPQFDALRAGWDVLVATPGRLLDHAGRGSVDLSDVTELVLDEADHMLDLGFLPQITEVLNKLSQRERTMMFSATLPEPIERLVERIMNEPVRVDLRPDGRAAAGLEHRLYLVQPEDKKRCLLELLHEQHGSTLVFIRRRTDAEWLSKVLEKEGQSVERIHANRSQRHRVAALDGFREGKHRILVATDVAARGIDVPGIDHIVNFELPASVEDYIHRAGRTARGSAEGLVSSIGTWIDKPKVRSIERALGKELVRSTVAGVEAWEELRGNTKRRARSPLRRRTRLR